MRQGSSAAGSGRIGQSANRGSRGYAYLCGVVLGGGTGTAACGGAGAVGGETVTPRGVVLMAGEVAVGGRGVVGVVGVEGAVSVGTGATGGTAALAGVEGARLCEEEPCARAPIPTPIAAPATTIAAAVDPSARRQRGARACAP